MIGKERHVRISGRVFVATFDDEGVRAIKERVTYDSGPAAGGPSLWNKPRWQRSSHPRPQRGLVAQAIEQAEAAGPRS